MLKAYSFADVICVLTTPTRTLVLAGTGEGVADEGITIEKASDRNTTMVGCNGEVMHCLHSGKNGIARIRLLKTGQLNGELTSEYNTQSTFADLWGRNNISVRDKARGDDIVCQEVAFTGIPALVFGKEGSLNEWTFHVGHIIPILDLQPNR